MGLFITTCQWTDGKSNLENVWKVYGIATTHIVNFVLPHTDTCYYIGIALAPITAALWTNPGKIIQDWQSRILIQKYIGLSSGKMFDNMQSQQGAPVHNT